MKRVIHRSNRGARLQKIQLKKDNEVNQDDLAIRVIVDLMGEMEAPERLVKNYKSKRETFVKLVNLKVRLD